jgi:beta-lactamase superfamily II metal-dependent hydrolase
MKLTVFQSEKGDCLLLTSQDNHQILIDGGMKASYTQFVAPALSELQELDLVYVSHIDQDHIAGVLQLVDDAVAWKVHEHQINTGNLAHPKPSSPKPPKIKEVWHNSFHEMLEANADPISDVLAATAPILSGTSDQTLQEVATEQREIATSIPEAIRLSRRVSPAQLGIPLNSHFGGKLAFVKETLPPPAHIQIGLLRINVIGPFEVDLKILRDKWNQWLIDNQGILAEIQKQAKRDAERLGTSDVKQLLDLQIAQAEELGKRKNVTPPNLASLMLLVEENGQSLLLTGDGHADDILKGLAFHSKLDSKGRIHVDVLKVQHHGSEHNIHEDFVAKVTADQYIFCGNGEHENPDLRVVQLIMDSRFGSAPFRSKNPKAKGEFTLWFNSSESSTIKPANKEHMKKVVDLVKAGQSKSNGKMKFNFLQKNAPFMLIES